MKNLTVFLFVGAFIFLSVGKAWSQEEISKTIAPCKECEELLKLDLPDVHINEARIMGNNRCRVRGVIGDEIRFILLLPLEWNERFVMGGGGGYVGTVSNTMQSRINQGYATVGTDTGHEGSNMEASWALNNIERRVNFGFLAIHRTAEVSKAIIKDYYGSKPLYSYFGGCSRGGGQGLMEAQRYPDDFDGILVGAPGFEWPEMALKFIDNYKAQFPVNKKDSEGVLTLESIKLLEKIVMDQFDELDGVKDNYINDPSNLIIDYSKLPVCPDGKISSDCFTSQQINTIKTFYGSLKIGNEEIYPGFPVGSELYWWGPSLVKDTLAMKLGYNTWFGAAGSEFFKYFVFNDPKWDLYDYNYSNFFKDTKYASSYLNSNSTDYEKFKVRGGKMIIYHGWNDESVSTFSTIQYFKKIEQADPGINDYIKLYLIPGMQHCTTTGIGPAEVDWLTYLRDWVEKGKEPHRIVLSKSEKGSLIMTRPVFPYPSIAAYKGEGDPKDHNSYTEIRK